MDASLIISIIALIISGVSVYFIYQRDQRDKLFTNRRKHRFLSGAA